MQLSNVPSTKAPSWQIAAFLWIGLGVTVVAALVRPAFLAASGLALAIAMLTLFVAAIVATFSLRYMRADRRPARFFWTLGLLTLAVLAFLFTGHLAVLAVAWCASGLLLAGLIGHRDDWDESEAAARRARIAFLVGDSALVIAFGLLAWHANSLQVDAVLAQAASLPPLVANVAAMLLVVAAVARCALPPFSGWLLSSMTAPTPVSALMHAGLVNAGGFLLLRFAPILEAAPVARSAALALGLFGAIYGVGIMMVRPDVKRSLAGSTISQMGFMIMSCGLGAYAAALWHIIAHGLFKAWLFLGSGSTIGMRSVQPTPELSRWVVVTVAIGTVGTALLIMAFGGGDAGLVPLLLAFATAAAALVAALGGRVPLRVKLVVVLLLMALISFHSAGLAVAGMAIGPDAQPLVRNEALIALLMVFLGGWAWQQWRAASGTGLPLPLYAHFINAGALRPVGNGEQQ